MTQYEYENFSSCGTYEDKKEKSAILSIDDILMSKSCWKKKIDVKKSNISK